MRLLRLVLEGPGGSVTVRFHERLTVVAGLGPRERESLLAELAGALSGTRRGTHLELLDDAGRRLAVLRQEGVADRVVDMETGTDVTSAFVGGDGRIDLLRWYGLETDTFRRRCRLTASDMAAAGQGTAALDVLATADQDVLWATAARVVEAEATLRREAEAAGAAPEDAAGIEEIDRRHAAFEAAQARLEYVRHHGIFVGGACVTAAVPALLMHHVAAFPFLLVAIATTVLSIAYRRRMERARREEKRALDEAGATSYVGFHLQRLNALMAVEQDRQRLASAAIAHREALDAWRALAGEVSVEWALDQRERVLAAARRRAAKGTPVRPAVATGVTGVEPAELAHAFIVRMNDLRHAGAGGESLPLVLDEPLAGLYPSVKQWLLELIGRSAGLPQVIYLTGDADIAAWARMEAVSGEVGVLEPAPEETPSGRPAR